MLIIYDPTDTDKVIDIKGYPTGWPYDKEQDIKILNLQHT
jgi:hypothetical protein